MYSTNAYQHVMDAALSHAEWHCVICLLCRCVSCVCRFIAASQCRGSQGIVSCYSSSSTLVSFWSLLFTNLRPCVRSCDIFISSRNRHHL